jgi:hypothetical protein
MRFTGRLSWLQRTDWVGGKASPSWHNPARRQGKFLGISQNAAARAAVMAARAAVVDRNFLHAGRA